MKGTARSRAEPDTTVPYQAVRDEVLRALPYPETTIALNTLYLPTEPIVSATGVVNPQVGRWRGSECAGAAKITSWPRPTWPCSTGRISPSLTRVFGRFHSILDRIRRRRTIVNFRTGRIASPRSM
jgi:hypothetical protein